MKETIKMDKPKVTKKWTPKDGGRYYCVTIRFGNIHVEPYTWWNDDADRGYYKTNNCFKTRKEAVAARKRVKEALNA